MEDEKGHLDDIEFRLVQDWPTEEIIALYKAGSWWKDSYEPDGIPPLIQGSFGFVIAYSKKEARAVGMGRMISDGVSDGYIQDLVVFHDLRGRGIGKGMVRELVRFGKEKGLVWIGLIAEEGSKEFYEHVGFKQFKGTPMLYEPEGGRNGPE
jgi:ribosomal protein S18 acetylase RimI-like enzyme